MSFLQKTHFYDLYAKLLRHGQKCAGLKGRFRVKQLDFWDQWPNIISTLSPNCCYLLQMAIYKHQINIHNLHFFIHPITIHLPVLLTTLQFLARLEFRNNREGQGFFLFSSLKDDLRVLEVWSLRSKLLGKSNYPTNVVTCGRAKKSG